MCSSICDFYYMADNTPIKNLVCFYTSNDSFFFFLFFKFIQPAVSQHGRVHLLQEVYCLTCGFM